MAYLAPMHYLAHQTFQNLFLFLFLYLSQWSYCHGKRKSNWEWRIISIFMNSFPFKTSIHLPTPSMYKYAKIWLNQCIHSFSFSCLITMIVPCSLRHTPVPYPFWPLLNISFFIDLNFYGLHQVWLRLPLLVGPYQVKQTDM